MTVSPVSEPNLDRLQAIFKAHRARSGMSYDQLASRSGLTRGTLINLGTGRYRGDLRTWLLLAKAWDLTLDELLAPVWEEGKK